MFGPQILALEIAQLVVRLEIRGLEPRAALEPDHFHAGLAELGGEDAAGGADADDHDIGFFGCHGSALPALGPRLQADDGLAREGLLCFACPPA